jgi:phosphatidylglycerophosphate synthase
MTTLAAYRYKSWELPTPLLAVFDGTSDWIVKRLPNWLPPNVISVMGLTPLCIIATILPSLQQDYAIDNTGPRWILLVAALAMLWQEVCDHCDGKQARRLGVGSPLGCMVDHTFDGIVSLPVVWCVNMVLQFPPRLLLLSQAGAILVGLVQPWSERYKGFYPIYLAVDLVVVLMGLLVTGSVVGGDTVNAWLIYSPVGIPAICARTLVVGGPITCVAVYHIVSTLIIAREQGKLALAFGEVFRPLMVLPITLLWSNLIVEEYTRYISLVLTSFLVMYMLKEILHAMAHPKYEESYLVDKPLMWVYFIMAASSRFIPVEALPILIPCYAAVMVASAIAWVFGVFGTVQKRLGIVAMFSIREQLRDIESGSTLERKPSQLSAETDLDSEAETESDSSEDESLATAGDEPQKSGSQVALLAC